MARRIERLINLIAALLETARPLTAEDIRERIAGYEQDNHEAFRRAFERDKESLRSIGIPIELRKTGLHDADPDGYIIPKDKYYLPELDLEPDELAALRLAAEAAMGPRDQLGSGILKLSVDASEDTWAGPRLAWGADVDAEQPLLAPLYAAILDRRGISFTYRSQSGEVSKREIDPYGLVHRRGYWYLVGRDSVKDARRSFRVSRIEGEIEPLAREFDPPEGFDAESAVSVEPWEVGGDGETTVVVRFSGPLRWWPAQNMSELPVKDVEEGVEVELRVANFDALVSWVIGFGSDVEVLSPAEARTSVKTHLDPWLASR